MIMECFRRIFDCFGLGAAAASDDDDVEPVIAADDGEQRRAAPSAPLGKSTSCKCGRKFNKVEGDIDRLWSAVRTLLARLDRHDVDVEDILQKIRRVTYSATYVHEEDETVWLMYLLFLRFYESA